jgi:hypothetical protein
LRELLVTEIEILVFAGRFLGEAVEPATAKFFP